ncbi:galactose mutarotase-like protein [Thozetella sp. PMI_491]|nr:galactose mutarotase-like protein [Thozetella sp. PMI_491]
MVVAAQWFFSITATVKALWNGGSPFAGYTALWPADYEGKWIIQAEGIRIAFTNLNGGSVTNLWINDTNGNEIDVILGLDRVPEYDNYRGLLGGAIGRVAGHISSPSFEIDGVTFSAGEANGNNGTTTYNGGFKGWEHRAFDVASHTSNSITFVGFDRPSKHGFPGSAGYCMTHSVYPNEWRIAYGVTPTRTDVRIPVSLSLKTFFNLDGFGPDPDARTVAEQRLHLPFSGLRLEEDEHGIPTGDIKGNPKYSEHDFWSGPKPLREGFAQRGGPTIARYDDVYLIQRPQPWHWESKPAASLSSARSGIKMELYTDQEAVRIVTWDEEPARWSTST